MYTCLIVVEGFTEEQPKSKYHGNLRHYFGVAKADLFSGKDIIAELKAMSERFQKENPLLKSLIMHLKKNMNRLNRLCIGKNIELDKIFESYDPNKTGRLAF